MKPKLPVPQAPELKLPPKTDGRRMGDWLKEWLDHTADLGVPHNYLLWTGLSTIAAVAQRKIYRATQSYTVYPNLYVWLVGPPGARKTTAIRSGRNLLTPLKETGVYLTSDAPSVVGLMKDFNDIPQKDHQSLNGFIYELSSFFENAPDTMTGFLTAIYDGDADYSKRTRIGDKEHISFPWFNWIGGTTPRWMGDNLGANAVEGGLVARTLYVYSSEIQWDIDPEPEITPAFLNRCDALTRDLAHILTLGGQMAWEGGRGGDAYREWATFFRDPGRMPSVPDNRTQGYFVRKHIHLQKVAMLLSLARSDNLEISHENVLVARSMLEKYVEPSMKKAFVAVGANPFATDFERIADQIEMSGGMTLEQLTNTNFHQLDHSKLVMTLSSLEAAGRIIKDLRVPPAVYRPKTKPVSP